MGVATNNITTSNTQHRSKTRVCVIWDVGGFFLCVIHNHEKRKDKKWTGCDCDCHKTSQDTNTFCQHLTKNITHKSHPRHHDTQTTFFSFSKRQYSARALAHSSTQIWVKTQQNINKKARKFTKTKL